MSMLSIGLLLTAVTASQPLNPRAWATPGDYPRTALRQSRGGYVGFRIAVSSEGDPTRCEVTYKSGHDDLDALTCQLIMRRARFSPAQDADGKKSLSVFRSTITWWVEGITQMNPKPPSSDLDLLVLRLPKDIPDPATATVAFAVAALHVALLAQVVQRARQSFLVTEREVALFDQLAPDCAGRVAVSGNGVNAEFFTPDATVPSPFAPGEQALVFTGAMDYWPNVDAVRWFAQDMLPVLRATRPGVRFYIVGRSPTPAVTELASDAVTVTGTVPDVRPYLQHAAVVVAPLRLARGIQNKVLEAMAMAQPVVASNSCLEPIDAVAERDILGATTPDEFVVQVNALLNDPARAAEVGRSARQRVLERYSWDANLRVMDGHLNVPVSNRYRAVTV